MFNKKIYAQLIQLYLWGSYNVSFDASSLPSGMYLYKVETAQFSSVRKMMLMK